MKTLKTDYRLNLKKKLFISLFAFLLSLMNLQSQNASEYSNAAARTSGSIGGTDCSGFGYNALNTTNSGSNNTAIGHTALRSNSAGDNNTGVGKIALTSNTNGNDNTAVGSSALSNTDADENTAVGSSALVSNISGSYNTALGFSSLAGTGNSSSSYNVAVGHNTFLYGSPGNNNTTVGAAADLNGSWSNASAFGSGAITTGNDLVRIGDVNVTAVFSQNGVFTSSDGRFKYNVSESDVKGIEFIKLLRPVVYNFDTKKLQEFLTKDMPEQIRKEQLKKDFTKSTLTRQSGFIAQEVLNAAEKVGYDFNGIYKPQSDKDFYGLGYDHFVVPLVKAVQEQQKMIEEQGKAIEGLKQQLFEKVNVLAQKNNEVLGLSKITAQSLITMEQNEPNPFTHETIISYYLPDEIMTANMAVYDLTGKQISSFILPKNGASSIAINSEKLAAGIYIYSIIVDGKIVESKRMVVSEN